MCNTDECVEMVKRMTAELFREQRELVGRLNAMHRQIEKDKHLASKVLRKIEWLEERDRAVKRLNKVPPSPHSVPPASGLNSLPQLIWGRAMTTADLSHLRADHQVSPRGT